jgi:hypothetical protein
MWSETKGAKANLLDRPLKRRQRRKQRPKTRQRNADYYRRTPRHAREARG